MDFVSNSNQAIQSESSRTSCREETMIQTREEALSVSNGEKNPRFLSQTQNVKEHRWLKHTWFGPSKTLPKGSPQQAAIDACQNDSHMLVKSISRKNGHLFTTVDPQKFLSWLDFDRNFQEIIQPHKPVKVFFDIEYDPRVFQVRLENITELIKKVFPKGDIQISGSTVVDKHSYHVCINNYVFRNISESQLMKEFCNAHPGLGLDSSVYTQNRPMKCVNQSKGDGRVQQILEGYSIDYRKHILTEFFPDEIYYAVDEIDLIQYQPKEIIIQRKNNVRPVIDWSDLPDIDEQYKPDLSKLEYQDLYSLDAEGNYKDILFAIPCPPYASGQAHSHNTIWNIMRWAQNRSLELNTFIQWVRQRDGDDVQPYCYQWDALKGSRYQPFRTQSLIPIFQKYYPAILANKSNARFLQMNNLIPTHYIYQKWLTMNDIVHPEKYTLLWIGMGGNKTGSIVDFLRENPLKSWIWITPRVTLAENTLGRMKESNIPMNHYKEFYGKKAHLIRESKGLVIQLQSMHKVTAQTYDIVIIDEIESVLTGFLATDTHGKNGCNLAKNWFAFKSILQNTNKCFLLDAFMSARTTQLIDQIESEVINPYAHSEKKSNYCIVARHPSVPIDEKHLVVMNSYEALLKKLILQVNAGKKIYVFWPYGQRGFGKVGSKLYYPSIEEFKQLIVNNTGISAHKVKTYWRNTADSEIEDLKDASKTWENTQVVIANSKITVGVNFDNENVKFDDVFLFYIDWASPRDIVQSSARPRHINGQIYTAHLWYPLQKSSGIRIGHVDDPIFQNLVKNLQIEEDAKGWTNFMWFCEQAGYKLVKSNKEYDDFEIETAVIDNDNIQFSYDSIPDISDDEYDDVYLRQVCNKATMDDKIRLNKHFFKEMFYEEYHGYISEIWDSKQTEFYKKMFNLLNTPNNSLNKILRENNLNSYILPRHTYDELKISPELKQELEEEFKLRNYLKDSKTGTLVHKVFETYFGMKCFEHVNAKNMTKHAWYWDPLPDFASKITKAEQIIRKTG